MAYDEESKIDASELRKQMGLTIEDFGPDE